jgi:RNA polymerase sigma factor (TIGR02999 family)
MPQPAAELVELVYQELRRLAEGYVRREQAKSVQATELVHEVYLRLLKDPSPQWQDRGHFLAIAAISMRRLLVERARARGASKRGGDQIAVTLDERLLPEAATGDPVDLIAVDRALEALARAHPEHARVVELRFFGGLSVDEMANVLDLSPATVKRHWTFAKAWLLREMQGDPCE